MNASSLSTIIIETLDYTNNFLTFHTVTENQTTCY